MGNIEIFDMTPGEVERWLLATGVHIIFGSHKAKGEDAIRAAHGRHQSFIFFLLKGTEAGLRLEGGSKEERTAAARAAVVRMQERFGGELLE